MRLLVPLVAAALLLPLGPSTGVTAAPADETSPSLTIRLDGPPGDRALIAIALTLGGIDVSDERCVATSPDGLPTRECTQLDSGTYSLVLTGATDDMIVETSCTDLVATPIAPEAIPIDPNVGEIVCNILAARPSILLTGQYDNPFDPVLLDSADDAVICTADDLTVGAATPPIVFQRRWCPAPPGTYRIDRGSIDPVFVDDVYCVSGGVDFGPDTVVDPFVEIVVDGSLPWLVCDQGGVGPVVINVDWSGPTDQRADWFDGLELTVSNEGDLATDCVSVDRFAEPGSRAVRFICDVFVGRFTASVSGIPTGAVVFNEFGAPRDLSSPCGVIDNFVNNQGRCAVSITTPNTAAPGDVELPATGRTTTRLLAVGFSVLVAGLVLLAGSRRRYT